MAVVYRGVDLSLNREVAVKLLHPHLASDPESCERFHREAQAVARLHHPNIIEIFDFADVQENQNYLVTEFIHGKTLKELIDAQKTFFPELAAMIAAVVCEAIAHAHGLHIVHRDLKPENIMVDLDGTLKVMDFGIAKVLDQQSKVTFTGALLGSPAHMAPELLEERAADVRSDVFSIGTILYWLSTGKLPFSGKNPHQILKQIAHGTYADPQTVNPQVGADLTRILKKSMAHSPEDRYQTANEMKAALEAYLAGLGLGSTSEEIKGFFREPAGYLSRLRERVVEFLIQTGKDAAKARHFHLALEAFDRALAIEPQHPAIETLLLGLTRRRQWTRMIFLGAAALGALCIGLALFFALGARGPAGAPRTTPSVAAAATRILTAPKQLLLPPAATQTVAPQRSTPPGAAEGGIKLAVTPRAIKIDSLGPSARLSRLPVSIFTDPFFDRITIDEQTAGFTEGINDRTTDYGQRLLAHLTPGMHRIRIQNKACQDDVFQIRVPEGSDNGAQLEFRRQLQFRPATLWIESDHPNVTIWIDDVYAGYTSDSPKKPLRIPIEGRRPQRDVTVRLTEPNLGEIRKVLSVRAGEESHIRIDRHDFLQPQKEEGAS